MPAGSSRTAIGSAVAPWQVKRVSDLLAGPRAFVPALRPDGTTLLVARDAVVWVRLPVAAERDPAGDAVLPSELDVRVRLRSGGAVTGYVSFVRPADSGRLADHLNDADPILHVIDDESVVLVRKSHVASVEPLVR